MLKPLTRFGHKILENKGREILKEFESKVERLKPMLYDKQANPRINLTTDT